MKFRGYKLFFENRLVAESMARQIEDFPSFFIPTQERPLIIDCGANIGVSVLEWKTRWPGSRVICFEPDPNTFAVLSRNIERNDIPDVRCIQAAVADHDGKVTLYGDVAKGGDARGNSIEPSWGQRQDTTSVEVTSTRLSRYLNDDIGFLKLDIEGAEQSVLTEIKDHLKRVEAIYVEVHETRDTMATNSAVAIEQLLVDAGFSLQTESRYQEHALPPHLDSWKREVEARQTHLLGWR